MDFLLSSFHLLPDCSGSVDDCATLYFFYLPTSDYTECGPVGKHCGLLFSLAHLCPVLPPNPSPYQPYTHSRETPMWILHPLVLLQPQWQKHIVLFLTWIHTLQQQCMKIHTHTHREGVFSIRLKHTVFTLADPLGVAVMLLTLRFLSLGKLWFVHAHMITSHTYSTFRPHL